MSFSSGIKQVLCKTEYECPACRRAELAGFFAFPDRLGANSARLSFPVPEAAERIGGALFAELGITVEHDGKRGALAAADAVRVRDCVNDGDVINECCSKAYLRGAFLGAGSVSNPEREYHLEFGTKSVSEARFLTELLKSCGFRPKATRRKDKNVVYIKEISQIADLIGYMSGGRAGLQIMSVQVERNLKGNIQRRVNCDSANLSKLAAASAKQIAAIRKIKAARKWSALPEVLRETGDLRLKYPDASLEELGRMSEPEIGKSGVNHRLKRIMAYADLLPNKEGNGK